MRALIRRWVAKLLGLEDILDWQESVENRLADVPKHYLNVRDVQTSLSKRVDEVARQFITKRSPDGTPVETLADVQAARDSKKVVAPNRRNWDQRRRMLEAADAMPVVKRAN